MRVEEYVAELTALGVTLYEEAGRLRYRAPKGALTPERLGWLRDHKDEVLVHLKETELGPGLVPEPGARHEPFPLTDVQAAYLLGRSDAFDYGGVACHGYLEIALPGGAAEHVEDAWNHLVRRHDMLRAVVSAEGHQRVLPEVPRYEIRTQDLSGRSEDDQRRAVEEIRGAMSHQVRQTDRWPLFELRTTRVGGKLLLHVAVDLLICDYGSIRMLLGELHGLCGGAAPADPPQLTFRDYVLAARGAREGSRYQRDRDYWWDRVDALPPAPELPLRTDAVDAPPRFRRHGMRLTPQQWAALGRRSAAAGVTPSGALLQSFAEVLGRWSRTPRFTLSLTLQNRLPLHPEVDRVIGDFSSTSLLAVDLTEGATFLDRTRAAQARLWDDMDHGLCSGVEVLREIARRRGRAEALMPVTFTSVVGGADRGDAPSLMPGGELVYGITQTPQVWIDCQTLEDGGGLLVHWDVREGLFPDGVVEDMFGAFAELVRQLADGGAGWESADPAELPRAQLERLAQANATEAARSTEPLHAEVVAQARRTPDRAAVITSGRTLDYAELLGRAAAVAAALTEAGVARGERVGIVMDKGWEQVVGALGVLLAGGAYLPVDTTQPALRRDAMLTDAGVRQVLTQSWLAPGLGVPAGTRTVVVDTLPPADGLPATVAGDPDDLAYVIYTSGSTGTPKGVMISHAAARNTVDDINSRFGVGAEDRVLGLAQLGFDLSVYDLFGPLAAGGAVVLPDAGRRGDPTHWADLIERFGVTVWNSVPAQMQMLHEYLRTQPALDVHRLRLALLSGDWIPVTLPDAVRQRVPGLRVVSLGGATEAAIWSIHHPVTTVDPALGSIPYGRPLANQTIRVLDPLMRDCPEQVTGELYIGGVGLALGYLGDAARTEERFVRHPHSGERLYRTGDMGRRMANAEIEFLGRADGQVKLNGHRVELAEVEAVLQGHDAVHLAATVVRGEGPSRKLVAFAEPARTERPPLDAALARAAGRRATAEARFDEAAQGADVRAMGEALDESGLQAMTLLLRGRGLFAADGDRHTAEEITAASGAAPQNHYLVRRWLTALAEAGRVVHDQDSGTYHGLAPVTGEDRAAVRERVDALEPRVGWGAELVRFHRDCEENLARLLSGELPLKDLLFPEGRLETAAAAYRDNLISRYNNAAVIEIVRRIALAHRGPGPLRILEIGAGVGGTSAALIPELRDLPVDYHFTDLSHFFLNEAQEAYRDHPWVRYGLFDLNEDYRAQGFQPNSADVIIAANVLHNAVHADEMLRRIRELAAPGGWLVFIDATRDTWRGMTSMEFNDGLTGFTDERAQSGATFFTRQQWLDLLRGADAEVAVCLPEEDSALAGIGQQVFAARFKADRVALTTGELHGHLAERLPGYMIPAELQLVDRIPLTANGKVDRGRLAEWTGAASAEGHQDGGEAPADELERALADLWSEVLHVPAVGRDANFFNLGGDSLLVAQLVGRMRERVPQAVGLAWDDLLRSVLNRPTVAALAAQLRSAAAEDGTGALGSASPLVEIDPGPGGADGAATLVLVHDGTGTVGPYRALVRELSGTLPVAGLVVDDLDAYLDADPATVIGELAGRYAETLLAAGCSKVHLVGYCMGGLLVTELADRMTAAGGEVTEVSIISSYRVPYLVEDDLLAEYIFARMMRADTVGLGYPQDESAIRELVTEVTRKHGDRVPPGSMTELSPDVLGAKGALALRAFRALAARTQEERLRAVGAAMPQESTQLSSPERLARVFRAVKHSLVAVAGHRATPYPGDVTLFRQVGEAEIFPGMHHDMGAYWQQVCTGGLRLVDVPGDHFSCVQPPHAAAVAALLAQGGAAGPAAPAGAREARR
ncbi:putative pyochelin synthetase [Streptomyces sp. NBRC 110611]|uniref:non-ribosomal peptide synthetase n=1 Tax=Streptomyces sp. NBRC 110611 TaxID=1621259 RepID=UPI0008319D45|nr:non-ribosomal peptide synthetase [Streptomyces sp. NBRC 110611]GAU68923.1 putative pyochelin synthetase [Streptomyces sp. NBRC 110611]